MKTIQELKTQFAGCEIKADPAVITAKADQVSRAIQNLDNTFQELDRLIQRTSMYWNGPAAEHFRALFNEEKPNIEDILKRLREHPGELKQMANNYQTTIEALSEENRQLRSDYI